MSTTSSVEVQTATGVDGSTYTTAISNDKLTNEDFLQLMLTQLSMQDPTSPMDTNQMLQNQLQMSAIETNQNMVNSMNSLVESIASSALTNAASLIGSSIETGEMGDDGQLKSYTVRSVENIDGTVYVNAQEIAYLENVIVDQDGESVTYDSEGYVYENGEKNGYRVLLNASGNPALDDSNNIQIVDAENEAVTQTDEFNYTATGTLIPVYNSGLTTISLDNISTLY